MGSILCPFLFNWLPAKSIIVGASVLNAASVCIFSFVMNIYVVVASRVLTGIFQVVFVIYFPVWID